ncbi:MAG: hypothetical protein ABSF80_04115 [Chitinispirillaceae bacterium]|jgi:hypothetical protein
MTKGLKILLVFTGIAGISFAIYGYLSVRQDLSSLTPWQCVGGCGAGGSGGTGAEVKWIGTGVSGGLVDAEVMGTSTIGENYRYQQIKTRLSWKPTWTTNLGLTVPIVSKIGSLQPATNWDDKTEVTGGLADLMVDFSKNVGMEGQYSLMLNLTLPTGQYDIKRGKENNMLYLPTTLQCGGGIYTASLGISRTTDVEKGLWIVEAYYNYPFAINFYGKNQFINSNPDQYNELNSRWELLSASEKKRFEYWFKPYGENDLGAYTPPSITAAVYYGYRGIEHYVHSFGAKLWVPFGVAWIPAFNASSYNPTPDPDNKTWSLTLHYGLEFSRPEYPIFISINKIIVSGSDKGGMKNAFDEAALRKWRTPDKNDLLDMWTFAIGIKTTMF